VTGEHGRPALFVGPSEDPDRYELGTLEASGAEGLLYRATLQIPSGTVLPVAVKMLHPQHRARLELWEQRWFEQLELLRSLHTPGLVQVREGFRGPLPHPADAAGDPAGTQQADTLYVVMNWVDGITLDGWLDRHPESTPAERLRLLLPVAAALDVMHSGASTGNDPVIHGDVKAQNILVGDDGRAVLVDCGLMRTIPGGVTASAVRGTVGYLAPELRRTGTYSPAVDRYALGAVAYHLLVGEPPANESTEDERAAALEAATTPAVAARVAAMVADDPAARPTILANWCAQLRDSSLEAPLPLEPLPPVSDARNPGGDPGRRRDETRPPAAAGAPPPAVAVGGTVEGQPIPPSAVPPSRRRRRVLAGAVAAAVAVAGVAAVAAAGNDETEQASAAAGNPTSTTSTTARPRSTTTSTAPSTSVAAVPAGEAVPAEVAGVQWCRNEFLGYQVQYDPAVAAPRPREERVGDCEAFNLLGRPAPAADLDESFIVLRDDIVITEVDQSIDEFFTTMGDPGYTDGPLVGGRRTRVVAAGVEGIEPTVPDGTNIYMYAADLIDRTLVLQAVIEPGNDQRTRFDAAVAAVDQMAATMTPIPATACSGSFDTRCGPFQWDLDPPPNDPLEISYTVDPPNPQAGDLVRFTVTVTDPDAPEIDEVATVFDIPYIDEATQVLPNQITRAFFEVARQRFPSGDAPRGTWLVPAEQRSTRTFEHDFLYREPGEFLAVLDYRSITPGYPIDPYASRETVRIRVTVTP
jgi:serine/threonine protein kinase